MSLAIKEHIQKALKNGIISKKEVEDAFKIAKADGVISADERIALESLETHASKMHSSVYARYQRLLALNPVSTVEPHTPPISTQPVREVFESTTRVWGSGEYWPMAGSLSQPDGDPQRHLWAKGGPADKFDQLLAARGLPTGALAHENEPYFGPGKGYRIPNSQLSEEDAERTTGIDFNGNGTIDPNVQHDFIDSLGRLRADGGFDGSYSTSWFGFCDAVASCNVLFEEPRYPVTLNGVNFTPMDIKGLLVMIVDSQYSQNGWALHRFDGEDDVVMLKNGRDVRGSIMSGVRKRGADATPISGDRIRASEITGDIQLRKPDGTIETIRQDDVDHVSFENDQDDAYIFHKTAREWMQSGRGLVLDVTQGVEVWNYACGKMEDLVYRPGQRPIWEPRDLDGLKGRAGDGDITFIERTATLGTGQTHTYRYWFEEKNGAVVNSGWCSPNPDFMWQPRGDILFQGPNERNPFVNPAIVGELYHASLTPPSVS